MSRLSSSGFGLIPLLLASGCILGGSQATPKDLPPSPTPAPKSASEPGNAARVAARWQESFLTRLITDKAGYHDAYGLFSQGGWADAGQVMVFVTKDGQSARLQTVRPGKKTIDIDRPLQTVELQQVLAQAQAAQGLADVITATFDGVEFEYVHATRGVDGKAQVKKRVFVRNPGIHKMPAQQGLINAFQALRRPPKS